MTAKKKKRVGKRKLKKKIVKQAKLAIVGSKRADLHRLAALLPDFHGGQLPIKSGCGRPRKRR